MTITNRTVSPAADDVITAAQARQLARVLMAAANAVDGLT